MDVVERGGLGKAHPCFPDVFTAVYRLHALYRVLDGAAKHTQKNSVQIFKCKINISQNVE